MNLKTIFCRTNQEKQEGEGHGLNEPPMEPVIPSSLLSISRAVYPVTERQQQIRQHTESLIIRVMAMTAAMLGSETIDLTAQRDLIAELQWWTDQYESDWALGLTDEPPPLYPGSEAAPSFLNSPSTSIDHC